MEGLSQDNSSVLMLQSRRSDVEYSYVQEELSQTQRLLAERVAELSDFRESVAAAWSACRRELDMQKHVFRVHG